MRSSRWVAFGIVLGLALGLGACGRSSARPTGTTQPTASASAIAAGTTTSASAAGDTGVRPDEYGPPEPVRMPAIDAICKKATCAGRLSTITVYYDKRSKIAGYEHNGDIQRCSHPPTTFFDRDGSELESIPMKPVVPGSEEQKKYDEIRQRHTKDRVAAGKHSCPDTGK